jgi:flagellar hook-associated protein 2
MSTSSSAVSSSALTFSGSSTFSADFQNVLNRAVSAANLPIQSLQNDVATLQSQQSALASLDSTFIGLQNAVSQVSAATTGSPGVSTSSSAVAATATASALPGTYTIQVNSLGSTTTTMSANGLTTIADPSSGNISSSLQYTLTVNGTAHTIKLTSDTLESLAAAINSAGDGVQATLVNIGSNTAPDYRLTVTSSNLAPDTIQLNDGTQDLLNTLSTGANATYQVNGQPTVISSSSSTVTLSPGLTVQLNQQTASPVTVTVSQGYSGLQTALSNLASAYNSAVNALAQDRGQAGGALTGQQITYQLTNVLQNIATYTGGSGSVNSLSGIGLTLDQTGQMSFNASDYSAAATAAIQQFLGTTTTPGFLQTANNALQSMTDPNKGQLQGQSNTLQSQIKADNQQITDDQSRVADLQANLQKELSAADAAIATLQAQTSYFQQLFTATYGNGTASSNQG